MGGQLDQVATKMDLALDSVGKLQQEQLQAARLQKQLSSLTPSLPGGEQGSILGSPSGVSFAGTNAPQPSPLPSQFGRPAQRGVDGDSGWVPEGSARPKSFLPKMDFPRFDGQDVRIWLDMCETYFEMYQIPENFKVSAAVLHLTGNAAQWYQSIKLVEEVRDWAHFRYAVALEFEGNSNCEESLALQLLTQTGTVSEYKQQFDSLVYQARLFDPSFGGMMLVSRFMLGLKEEIRNAVMVQLLDTVQQATAVALVQEAVLLEQSQSNMKKLQYKRTTVRNEPGLLSGDPPAIKPERAELWKAHQLRDFRRPNGLCLSVAINTLLNISVLFWVNSSLCILLRSFPMIY